MRRALLGLMLFVKANAVAQTVSSDVPPADRAAIGRTATAFLDAWNAHDAHAFALTSHQTLQVRSVRLLTPAIASVDIDWQMTGAV
jgi:hypothetical protein